MPRRIPRPLVVAALASVAVSTLTLVSCRNRPTAPASVPVRSVPIEIARPATTPTPTQAERVEIAQQTADVGDYQEALRLFQSLLSENPTLTTAFIGIGDIHLAQGNYKEAEPAFARAVRLEPENFDAQYGHGRVLQMLKRFADAVKAYHRALTIRPYDVEANINISSSYMQLDEPRLAVPFAEKAVELDPDSGSARINLGAAYERVGRHGDAIMQYELALELLEPSPPVLFSLINAYISEKRFQESINTAEILLRIEESANACERMGFAYFRMGEFQKSLEAYRRAVRIDPTHWPSWNGIGVNALNTWLSSDRKDQKAMAEARDAFRNSLRINADQPKVVALLSKYYTG